jgi:hypothetical protein
MNSVEALTDRPTSDPSDNGIMEGTGLPRSQAAKVGDACSSPASRLAASAVSAGGACRLASPDDIVPWETAPAVEPAAYVAQARSVVLLALALRGTA